MLKKEILICNKLGLHARAAAKLVTLASEFDSEIFLHAKGREVNGKSIMGVMMLAASKGSELVLCANGDDEQQALDAIEQLVNNRFDEES
ncbi:Phosphotransferase system, phosphocarrier protein HPr [hydrothermal vent metagenome]|uniref:Phosphotransferase system, phosphocarrier protein HPr n=1 Tax=hydrothermal vent metagenome TaxID=652676 RepID=A0A3B1BD52_9ZZZZ